MPITKSAIKKVRVDERKQKFNKIVRTKALSAIKSFRVSPKKKSLPALFSAIDRAAKKKIFHKKKADRLKSRLAKLVQKK
ncbi:30S ribosomal protein S20 [Patescibacteria group bacterium]|nr:30S ribosomal protein S20 [Patescibacteria group bacterium]